MNEFNAKWGEDQHEGANASSGKGFVGLERDLGLWGRWRIVKLKSLKLDNRDCQKTRRSLSG